MLNKYATTTEDVSVFKCEALVAHYKYCDKPAVIKFVDITAKEVCDEPVRCACEKHKHLVTGERV